MSGEPKKYGISGQGGNIIPDKVIAVPPKDGQAPEPQQLTPQQIAAIQQQMAQQQLQQVQQQQPQPEPIPIQKFVPLIINAAPVPPPPVINGKPVRLGIAVPATPWVDWRWAFWFSQLRMQFPTALVMADNKYGIAQSRESLFNQFNAIPDMTHMLFLDTDLIAPDYSIYTLLSDNVDIVSGMYWNSLFTGNAAWIDEKPLNIAQFNAQNMNVANPLVKVDKSGFGFTLISKDLAKKLLTEPRPLFYYKVSDGALHSEDFYFASILKRLEIPIYVDLRVQLQHIKTLLINCNGSMSI